MYLALGRTQLVLQLSNQRVDMLSLRADIGPLSLCVIAIKIHQMHDVKTGSRSYILVVDFARDFEFCVPFLA